MLDMRCFDDFFFFSLQNFFFFNSGEKGQEQKSCDYRNARLKQKEKKGKFQNKKGRHSLVHTY